MAVTFGREEPLLYPPAFILYFDLAVNDINSSSLPEGQLITYVQQKSYQQYVSCELQFIMLIVEKN